MTGRGRAFSRSILAAFVLQLCSGCSSVTPLGSSGNRLDLAEDEKRIWNRSVEVAKKIDQSGQLYQSPELVEYVNTVAAKLVPPELRTQRELSIQVRIIRNPLLNAMALSHGAIYLHTGMLAKLDNEAQLATILAHELAHITHRHPVQHFRHVQNISTAFAVLQLVTLPAGYYGSLVSLIGAIGATAAVTGYSRNMEAEADDKGLEMTVSAGYDPVEAPKLFEHLQLELADRDIDEPFFFGSHPKLQDRMENYRAVIAKNYAGRSGRTGAGDYADAIAPMLLDNAEMDLALGRWAWAENAIRRSILVRPENPAGDYLLGELYRRRGGADDADKALAHYRAALEKDAEFAPPYRALGLMFLKKGDSDQARSHFRRYLSLVPNTDDREYVQQYLATLESGAGP